MGRNKRRSWVSRSSKEIRKRRNVRSGRRIKRGSCSRGRRSGSGVGDGVEKLLGEGNGRKSGRRSRI
jgi:hypothetical protein